MPGLAWNKHSGLTGVRTAVEATRLDAVEVVCGVWKDKRDTDLLKLQVL